MSKRKLISLVAAVALAAGAFGPPTVHGGLLPGEMTAAVRPTHDTDESATAAQDEANAAAQSSGAQSGDGAPAKRQGGGLGRALSAPFRALAKLFGGGSKKDSKQAAKQRPDANAEATETAAQAPVVAASEAKVESAAKNDERAAVGRVGRARVVPAPSSGETTRVVRPAEERLSPRPGAWVPVIDGIPKDPLSQGRALLHHGYVNEAISELSIAATRGENLVEANNLLGLAYDRLGWHRMAIEAYERARSVAPDDPVVLANLGYSHYLDADYNAAVRRLKQAARLSPRSEVINNNLGVAQASAGKFGDAFKSFARAGGEYDAHVKLAGILETARRDRDAARHYEAALRIQPGTNAVLERLVELYERNGDRTRADTARRSLGKPRNEQKTTTGGG